MFMGNIFTYNILTSVFASNNYSYGGIAAVGSSSQPGIFERSFGFISMLIGNIFSIFFFLVFYVFNAICLMLLAKKTETPNGWMAWVPILNIYLMCKVAGKSGLWMIWFFIPIVNIIAFPIITVLLWVGIAQRVGRSGWWGILMLFPILNLIMMGILAFSKTRVPAMVGPGPAISPLPAVTQAPASQYPIPTTKGKKFCPQCGAPVEVLAKFCPSCGAVLPQKGPVKKGPAKKFCSDCGAEFESSDKFCPNCGKKL